jgi:hypothetical protein
MIYVTENAAVAPNFPIKYTASLPPSESTANLSYLSVTTVGLAHR